jgi:hypothetical protein
MKVKVGGYKYMREKEREKERERERERESEIETDRQTDRQTEITQGWRETDHIIQMITIHKSAPYLSSLKSADGPLPN